MAGFHLWCKKTLTFERLRWGFLPPRDTRHLHALKSSLNYPSLRFCIGRNPSERWENCKDDTRPDASQGVCLVQSQLEAMQWLEIRRGVAEMLSHAIF